MLIKFVRNVHLNLYNLALFLHKKLLTVVNILTTTNCPVTFYINAVGNYDTRTT